MRIFKSILCDTYNRKYYFTFLDAHNYKYVLLYVTLIIIANYVLLDVTLVIISTYLFLYVALIITSIFLLYVTQHFINFDVLG